MRNSNKKGFTIVELVIVIAVIAILAAVLIPTFSGIIRKANIASDTALAKNLNNALAIENAEDEINDFYDVMDVLAEYGYVITNLNAKANECYFAWEKNSNQIVLVDGKDGYKVLYAANDNYGDIDDSWYFAINDKELAKKVKTAYPTAFVFTSFEAPEASALAAPLAEVKQLYGKQTGAILTAEDDMYVAIDTNGATVSEIKIGEKTYTENDTFKVSIGQNSFLTFNYFKVEDDGTVSLPSVIVAYDAEAKYGVVGESLVMTTGSEKNDIITESGAYYAKQKVEKNAKGQYVITVAEGTNSPMFYVAVPEVDANGSYISKKSDGNYGISPADKISGADGYGYATYFLGYNVVATAEHDGMVKAFTVYFSGVGYVSFEIVIDVQ